MKSLLVAMNAKFIHSSLSVRTIASYGRRWHPSFEFGISEHSINENLRDVFRDIYQEKADLYGFSCYIWNTREVCELAMLLKKADPNCKIVAGGPEAFGNGTRFLKENPYIDYLICGEGEKSFCLLLKAIAKGDDLASVPGIMYRDQGGIRQTATAELLDLNEIPFPYQDNDMDELKNKLIYYESSRGCPFRCSYCMSSLDRAVRFKNIEAVKNDLRFFIDHHVPIVKFVDRTFNCDAERTKEIFRFLIERRADTLFHFEIAPDLLTEDILEVLRDAPRGLFQFEIGIQSTNEKTLGAVHRKSDKNRCFSNIRKLIEIGTVAVHVDLIAGLPEDSIEAFRASFNETYALGADVVELGFLKVLRGSPMKIDAEDYGLVYSDTAPYEIIKTAQMAVEDLFEIKKVEAALDYYYNSHRFQNSLPLAVSLFESPYDFFLAVSRNFNGAVSHAELCSALWKTCDQNAALRFYLTVDYLLENRGRELPEYLSLSPMPDRKRRSRAYFKEKYKIDVREAMKHLFFVLIEDKIVEIDYSNKKWNDVTDVFPS